MDKVQDEEAAHITPRICIMCHIQRDKLCNKLEISVSGDACDILKPLYVLHIDS